MSANPQGETPSTSAEIVDCRKNLYLVLEGGGAKGIVHIAAWEILDDLLNERSGAGASDDNFKLSGVAGTSAGAVVAAFIAAGASPKQLIDSEGRIPLCGALHMEYFYDLFGVAGWRRLKQLRWLSKPSEELSERLTPRLIRVQQHVSAEHVSKNWPSPAARTAITVLRWLGLSTFTIVALAFLLRFIIPNAFAVASIGLAFWILANLCFAISRWHMRHTERRRKEMKRRHMPRSLRLAYNPITTLILSAIVTLGIALQISREQIETFKQSLESSLSSQASVWVTFSIMAILMIAVVFKPMIANKLDGKLLLRVGSYAIVAVGLLLILLFESFNDPSVISYFGKSLLYSTAIVAVAWSAFSIVRQVLKGTVNTEALSDDLNAALVAVITKDPIWNDHRGVYEWVAKSPKDESERRLFDRINCHPDRHITFEDLYDVSGISISVVASDIVENRFCVFSSETHKQFSVAKAVTASLAIPIAFRPVKIGRKILVDGGVISSIPAWIYRRHRSVDPDARILAVGVSPGESDHWLPYFLTGRRWAIRLWESGGVGWIQRLMILLGEPQASATWPFRMMANVASTAAFGARELELDASDRLDSVRLHTSFGLLDFDKSREEARAEVERLRKEARFAISEALWNRKSAFVDVCRRIEDDLRFFVQDRSTRFRMSWAERDGLAAALRTKFTYNFQCHELDDRLVLPFHSSLAGLAYSTGRAQIAPASAVVKLQECPMNRYRNRANWDQMTWRWSIPVGDGSERKAPFGVFTIDSDCEANEFVDGFREEVSARLVEWTKVNFDRPRNDSAFAPAAASVIATAKMVHLETLIADLLRTDFISLRDGVRGVARRDQPRDVSWKVLRWIERKLMARRGVAMSRARKSM